MQTRRYTSFSLPVILFLLISMLFAACGGSSAPSTSSGNSSNTPLINVSIGLGYIPDVQFAPFYVAVRKGYYKAVGLNVTLNHGIVPDIMQEMMAARDTFVFAGGDD